MGFVEKCLRRSLETHTGRGFPEPLETKAQDAKCIWPCDRRSSALEYRGAPIQPLRDLHRSIAADRHKVSPRPLGRGTRARLPAIVHLPPREANLLAAEHEFRDGGELHVGSAFVDLV